MRLLLKAITQSDIAFHKRPASPLDIIAARKKQIGLSKIAELTE